MRRILCGVMCGVAIGVCATSRAGSIVSVNRSAQTDALIKAFAGGGVSNPQFEESFVEGLVEWALSSSVSLGESFAFASAQQHSDVQDGLFTMLADADAGGFAGMSGGSEGTPMGKDFVLAFADSVMDVVFEVTADETWTIDAEAFGFDEGFAFVELTEVIPIDGPVSVPVFQMDTRLGQKMLHTTVTLTPGTYFLSARCTSDFGPFTSGGFWTLDMTFERVTATPCPGDANGDRVVDFLDLNLVLSFFGQSVTAGTSGDLNGDGAVDFLDLNIVLSFFGTAC